MPTVVLEEQHNLINGNHPHAPTGVIRLLGHEVAVVNLLLEKVDSIDQQPALASKIANTEKTGVVITKFEGPWGLWHTE